MELILWRHAEAEDGGGDDAARALTRRGHKQARLMAAWLKPRLGRDWKVYASPAKRAVQTVEPLGRDVELAERIGTSCGPEDVLAAARWPDGDENVLVVGHQPTLGQVAARLLGEVGDVSVRKGAIWWFATRERGGRTEVVLRAVLNPELLED